MSVLQDDKGTDRKGMVTTTLDNRAALKKIEEDLRTQRKLYTVAGSILGGVGAGIIGLIKWAWDR